jgi:hypothetical protein
MQTLTNQELVQIIVFFSFGESHSWPRVEWLAAAEEKEDEEEMLPP